MRGGPRSLLFLLGLLVCGLGRAQESSPVVGGMPEDLLPGLGPILKTALARSPETIRRDIDRAAAEARRHIGESVLWPTLRANGRYAVNQESTVSGGVGARNDASGFFYEAVVNQPIYQWGALKARANIDRLGVKITDQQFNETYRSLALLLRRGYLDLIAKKATLRAVRSQLVLDEAAVPRVRERLAAGAVSPGELAAAELTVEQRKLAIDRAAGDLDYFRRGFMRVAGLAELPEEAIPQEIAVPVRAAGEQRAALLQAFARDGANGTFKAQELALGIKQSEESYVIAKRRLYPKFSLYVGYSVRSETQADVNRINQVAVASRFYGIRTDWDIFDGFATKGEKLAAQAAKRTYERNLESHLAEQTDLARYHANQVEFAARALDLAERQLTGAQAGLKQVREDFEAGRTTQLAIDLAQQGLQTAEAAIVSTRADYLNRWAEFVSLVGADPAMQNLPARHAR